MLKNTIKHFNLVMKHKWYVFIFCCKLGMPIRGFMHDMSKFSPTEFCESVKYFNGKRSPISICRESKGYSEAWLHHRGRNKHHYEYWYDENTKIQTPVMPYKYTAEMICDKLSASKVYNGKNWTTKSMIEYWNKEKLKNKVNDKISAMLTEVFEQVADRGINPVLTRKNIKALYKKHCEEKNEN